jgi:16S rRNA (guanine527-N7)-methyltransferase
MTTGDQLTFNVGSVLKRHVNNDLIDRYYVELMKANEKVNLVSRETSRPDFDRLCAESLFLLDLLPAGNLDSYLDIGSGGGIPAIPLLLSGRITGKAVLVERTQKKAAALQKLGTSLGLAVEVITQNFEEVSLSRSFDLITLRYVKLTPSLLKEIMSSINGSGRFAYYSSPDFEVKNAHHEIYHFKEEGSDVIKSLTVFRTK